MATMMPHEAHFWAVAYDDQAKAERARAEITRLAGPRQSLLLLDVAILARALDGTYTINRETFPVAGNMIGGGLLGLLAGLVVAAPLAGAAIGALLGTAASAVANSVGIDDSFIRDVERLIKPGTWALLVLDEEGDVDMILHAIQGLGGTILKTNADLESAKLVQATLNAKVARFASPRAAIEAMHLTKA